MRRSDLPHVALPVGRAPRSLEGEYLDVAFLDCDRCVETWEAHGWRREPRLDLALNDPSRPLWDQPARRPAYGAVRELPAVVRTWNR